MAAVTSDTTTPQPDGSSVRTILYTDGSQSVQFIPGDNTPVAVAETLRQQAAQALAANRTYVALASPTAAQTTAQVKALSRQHNGLIRLLLGLLDGTD